LKKPVFGTKTLVLENDNAMEQVIRKLSYPLIFKPVDGVGARV
jgi:glutathione synthase/RimK-type ligase-like ATP-grasp enzyme